MPLVSTTEGKAPTLSNSKRMKTLSFPLNKFKCSVSRSSSHVFKQPDQLGKRLSTVWEGNSQATDLTARPCLPHFTTKPRPSNPQARSLFTGKVVRGRLPHLYSRNRMPGENRKPPGPRTPFRPSRGARVPPQSQEGDFHADLHPSHTSPHASSPSHLRKLALHSSKLQTHTRTCHASEMDKRPPLRDASHTDLGAGAVSIPFPLVLFLSHFV